MEKAFVINLLPFSKIDVIVEVCVLGTVKNREGCVCERELKKSQSSMA